MNKKSIQDIDVDGKKVLVRIDIKDYYYQHLFTVKIYILYELFIHNKNPHSRL